LQFSPVFQRRAAWIGAAIAIAAYYPRYRHGNGTEVFVGAADCLLRGQTPQHCGDLIYAYPPFFALLWTPLAPLPAWLHEALWYPVIIGTIFVSLRLCETLARRLFPGDWSEGELAAFRTLTFVLSLKFILAVLENQAYDSIAVVSILLGLLALLNGRSLRGAACLAFAAALKVTPLIFLPYLLFKRRFAAAGLFTAVFVVLSLLPDIVLPSKGPSYAAVWVRDVLMSPFFFDPGSVNMRFWVTDSPMNQTFRAAIVRLFTGIHEQQTFGAVLAIMQSRPFAIALNSVMGLYVAVVGLTMLKSRRDDRLIGVDGALLVISALLLTPVSSQSHFLALLLPYALLAAAAMKDPPMRLFYGAMLLTSFVLATATSNDAAGRSLTAWALWSSLPVYGTLILVAPLGVLIWRVRGRQAGASATPG
jgi:hypothetical protein